MTDLIIYLKKSKSGLKHSAHPWIFDGALDMKRSGDVPAGAAMLYTADGDFVATGTFNPKSAIAFRVLDTTPRTVDTEFFAQRFTAAKALRDRAIDPGTDGFRWVNSEGDALPGLTVDTFGGHLAVQVGTPGMDALSASWLEAIKQVFRPESVTRKDSQPAANREHMTAVSRVLMGDPPEVISFREAGIDFRAAVLPGQKTGFFFDQRDNRIRIARLARGRRVLDCYAYTGGFGAHSLKGGAAFVTGVDSSAPACEMMRINYQLNADAADRHETVHEDCVRYLKETDRTFDVAVLDPPALAKRRHHLPKASRLYLEIFASGMRRIAPEGGFVSACSCSAAVDIRTLLDILRQAAASARRTAQVLHIGGAGADHPVSLHHPEGEYLKSVLLRIV